MMNARTAREQLRFETEDIEGKLSDEVSNFNEVERRHRVREIEHEVLLSTYASTLVSLGRILEAFEREV